MTKEYISLKHGRVVVDHELSFEYSRVMEGKDGEKHSLAPKPETFLDKLKGHGRKMRRMFRPVKTRSRIYHD